MFLFDLDGTIYIDDKIFDKALEFLNHIKDIGGKYLFLTNNSSNSISGYIEKFKKLNIDVKKEDFITSAYVTAIYLVKHHKDDLIYVVGNEFLKEELRSFNLNITEDINPNIKCLVVGFDTELTYKKINDACNILTRDIDFIATNPDPVCPTSYGSMPDCGAICEMIEHTSKKKPMFIGKPQPDMIYYALKKTGYNKSDALMVGDRIYTDIACGFNAGVDTALVLSGEAKKNEVKKSKIKPDYIFKDIKELYESFLQGDSYEKKIHFCCS